MHFTQGMTLCPQGAGKPATVPLREEMREWQALMLVSDYSMYLWILAGPMSSQVTTINPSVAKTR